MTTELVTQSEAALMTIEEHPDALTTFASVGVGIESARHIAVQLQDIVEKRELFTVVNGKRHLHVEAWCTCASLCGLSARTEWSKRITDNDGNVIAYESRVEVIRLANNAVIGAAEAECWMDEKLKNYLRWNQKFEAKSMSQTRATSKAIAQLLRWIPILAGYDGTPAEEMADRRELPDENGNPSGNHQAPRNPPRGQRITKEEFKAVTDRWNAIVDKSQQTKEGWVTFCKKACGEDFDASRFPGEWDTNRLHKTLTAIARMENGEI